MSNLFADTCKIVDDASRLPPALSKIEKAGKKESEGFKLTNSIASPGFFEFFTGFCDFDRC